MQGSRQEQSALEGLASDQSYICLSRCVNARLTDSEKQEQKT